MQHVIIVDGATGEVQAESELVSRVKQPHMPKWTRLFQVDVEKILIDGEMRQSDKLVLLYMISRVHRENMVWLYARDIARALKFNEKAVYVMLQRLRTLGHIRVIKPGLYAISRDITWQGDANRWAEAAHRA